MIEYIKEAEKTQEDLFEEYYSKTVSPLVEKDTAVKKKYRGRFWASLWTVCFFISANSLVTFFIAMTRGKEVNYEQLMLINIAALFIIYLPFYNYYHQKKDDLFAAFIGFYGNWKHIENVNIAPVHRPIIPEHETLEVTHKAEGPIGNVAVNIRDTVYRKTVSISGFQFQKVVSRGVRISLKLPRRFPGTTLLFEKFGFYRKNSFSDYNVVRKDIKFPAAGYFLIFSTAADDDLIFLENNFFETVLDLKESFKAAKIYLEIKEDSIEMYLEGCRLYFDTHKFWSISTDAGKFRELHDKFEHLFSFTETIMILTR